MQNALTADTIGTNMDKLFGQIIMGIRKNPQSAADKAFIKLIKQFSFVMTLSMAVQGGRYAKS